VQQPSNPVVVAGGGGYGGYGRGGYSGGIYLTNSLTIWFIPWSIQY
jgi:hypothetical protein